MLRDRFHWVFMSNMNDSFFKNKMKHTEKEIDVCLIITIIITSQMPLHDHEFRNEIKPKGQFGDS